MQFSIITTARYFLRPLVYIQSHYLYTNYKIYMLDTLWSAGQLLFRCRCTLRCDAAIDHEHHQCTPQHCSVMDGLVASRKTSQQLHSLGVELTVAMAKSTLSFSVSFIERSRTVYINNESVQKDSTALGKSGLRLRTNRY